MNTLADVMNDNPNADIDDLTNEMMNRANEIYEENMETVRDENGVSSFFDFGSSDI